MPLTMRIARRFIHIKEEASMPQLVNSMKLNHHGGIREYVLNVLLQMGFKLELYS